jgi:hypothetical protein
VEHGYGRVDRYGSWRHLMHEAETRIIFGHSIMIDSFPGLALTRSNISLSVVTRFKISFFFLFRVIFRSSK